MAGSREAGSTASGDEEEHEWHCFFFLPFFERGEAGEGDLEGRACFLGFSFFGFAGDDADEESSFSLEDGTGLTSSSSERSVCADPPGFSALEEPSREGLRLVSVSPGRARVQMARPRIEGQRAWLLWAS
jgi:hypothetical protein